MTSSNSANQLELSVRNFGPIAEGLFELRPMTVFVGPSNSGKSYMAALIYALHRFFCSFTEDDDYSSILPRYFGKDRLRRIRGFNVGFSDSDIAALNDWIDSLAPTPGGQPDTGRERDSLLAVPESVVSAVRPHLDSVAGSRVNLDADIARCFGVDPTNGLIRQASEGDSGFSLLSRSVSSGKQRGSFQLKVALTEHGADIDASFPQTFPFRLSQDLERWRSSWYSLLGMDRSGKEVEWKFAVLKFMAAVANDIIVSFGGPFSRPAHFLPADRAGILHVHQVVIRSLISSATLPVRPSDSSRQLLSGVLGDFLDQLVSLAGLPDCEESVLGDLAKRIEEDVLQGIIKVGSTEIDYPSFLYRPRGWDRDLALVNSSSMISELTPVILYLRHVVRPGDLLVIEEPESHLHPEMQAKFTRQLVTAVQSGVRILITTHSEWILEELANLVRLSDLPVRRREGIEEAEIALSSDQLGAWFFEPNQDAGGSVVREISLDEESATFPAGFGLVTESLYNRWVEISARIQEE